MGILETIRAAVVGPVDDAAPSDEPGANTSTREPSGAQHEEQAMPATETATGADKAGISEADHKAAVAKAETDGKAIGRKEANDRMATVLGAEGIKGDGGRMAAAFDLANQSPDMAADAVVGYVTANVTASKPAASTTTANDYEQKRLAAAGLTEGAGNGGGSAAKADLSPSSIYEARRAANQKGA